MFGLVSQILVSSANKIGRALCSTAFGKSLIYNRNSNGPRIEPCDIPYFVLVYFETLSKFIQVSNVNSLIPILKIRFEQ